MPSTHGDRLESLEKLSHAIQVEVEKLNISTRLEIQYLKELAKDHSVSSKEAQQLNAKLTERVSGLEAQTKALEKS